MASQDDDQDDDDDDHDDGDDAGDQTFLHAIPPPFAVVGAGWLRWWTMA
jgi:hypothetical protein